MIEDEKKGGQKEVPILGAHVPIDLFRSGMGNSKDGRTARRTEGTGN